DDTTSFVASVFCRKATCDSQHVGRQTRRKNKRVLLARVPTNGRCPEGIYSCRTQTASKSRLSLCGVFTSRPSPFATDEEVLRSSPAGDAAVRSSETDPASGKTLLRGDEFKSPLHA